jgi:thiamine-phosphate pyrophosphorylase
LAGLYLITPEAIDLATFPARLKAALEPGKVSCLLIAPQGVSDAERQAIAEALVPIAQKHDVAVLLTDDTRTAGRAKADGVHISSSIEDLKAAVKTFRPGRIVGAGGLKTRHEAMEAAEMDVDYVFFGLIDRPEDPETHPKSLDLATWWVPLFEAPVVIMAGATLESVREAAETGAEFVAVRHVVWSDPEGPASAILAAAAAADVEVPA